MCKKKKKEKKKENVGDAMHFLIIKRTNEHGHGFPSDVMRHPRKHQPWRTKNNTNEATKKGKRKVQGVP